MKINIVGTEYKVKAVVQDDIPGKYGECNKAKKEIKIAPSDSIFVLQKTIMHEITHAYLEEMGYRYITFENEENREEFMCEVNANVMMIHINNREKIEEFIGVR